MNRVIVIHPQDETTAFLEQVVIRQSLHLQEYITHLRPDKTAGAGWITASLIPIIPHNSIVFFLGHGHSRRLYGTPSETEGMRPLFRSQTVSHVFKPTPFLAFACNSNELLKSIDNEMSSYIGFGNMPTQHEEIVNARESDANAYYGATENTITRYREILTEAMTSTLAFAIGSSISARAIYLHLRLALNKQLLKIPSMPGLTLIERVALYDLVQITKHEMIFK